MEEFDQAVLKFSQWSETMISNLHSSSQIKINNLQSASAHVKVKYIILQFCPFFSQLSQRADSSRSLSRSSPVLLGNTSSLTEAVQCEAELGTADGEAVSVL